ncbi:MAG TPA: serine hydrolase, partial [Thermomicrobiales bacterium]|nr:serine hydrolase [Thermomicrobiales bacterium]
MATRRRRIVSEHDMGKVRFNISMSIDGYVAGPDQSLDNPLGKGGEALHEWVIPTRAFRAMQGLGAGGETGLDDDRAAAWSRNIGATIMGRNMFGPIRGDWGDERWRGWWGDNPPYHGPVFVLTHHARDPIEMDGGTTFYFVTDGPDAALERARAAAGDADVNIGGGAATARQYLRAGAIDEMELHVVPVILGGGERLFDDLDRPPAGLEFVEVLSSPRVAHFRYARPEPDAQQMAAGGRDRRIRAAGNPGSATTQATPAARFDPVRDAMAAQVERGVAPGLVFLVAQGSEVHAEAIGMKSFERRDPMRRDTIFRITSMTKPSAAAAAMVLVEAGKLALDEPVDRLLPELADRRVLKRIDGPLDDTVPTKRPITVRDLLTFRLGFGLLFDPSSPIVQAATERGINIVPPDPSIALTPD